MRSPSGGATVVCEGAGRRVPRPPAVRGKREAEAPGPRGRVNASPTMARGAERLADDVPRSVGRALRNPRAIVRRDPAST